MCIVNLTLPKIVEHLCVWHVLAADSAEHVGSDSDELALSIKVVESCLICDVESFDNEAADPSGCIGPPLTFSRFARKA